MGVCKVIYKDNTLVDLTQDTVTAGDLRQGVTAHNSNGDLVTGTMQDQGTLNQEISTVNQVVEIPEGYHSGYGSVEIAGSEQAKIIPENIKAGVQVLGVTGDYDGVDTSSDTITADKLLEGQTAHNSAGEQITGSMTDNSGTSGTISSVSDSFTIPEGYHDGQGTVQISESERAKIIPENIKSGVKILDVTGTASGEGGGSDTSGDTVTASDLLAGVTAHDASGNQITGTMINRGQVIGSMSFANDVFAIAQGYHDGTGSVTIDSAEQSKIIPGNIKSGVSILGVTGDYEGEGGSGVDTSGDTVTASNLRSGYTAHNANGEAITGTLYSAALEPYVENLQRGWIGQGDGIWAYENPTQAYADVYQVIGEHSYFLTMGANVGTRFRVMFTTEDVSISTENITGIAVNTKNYNNPVSYQSLQYTPETDGYLVIQKDNAGNPDIKTYLYDMNTAWL